MGKHIRPEGWHNWGKEENEKTARYAEYNSTGEGAAAAGRVKWAKQLTKKEAAQYDDLNYIYRMCSDWKPEINNLASCLQRANFLLTRS